MRLLIHLFIAAGAITLALALGLLRPGLTTATLQSHADRTVTGCLHTAGYAPDPRLGLSVTSDQAQTPRGRALARCWSDVANDASFERLELVDPIQAATRERRDGFKAWRCTERAGYARLTPIPLSGPGGYPLQLAAGNFRVGRTPAALERFYRVAARCSGEPLDGFRWTDGSFSRQPADGTRCLRHGHHGPTHSHGCAVAHDYPGGL